MSNALNPDTLTLFLLFAVPGIVTLYVRAQFLTGRLPPVAEGLVGYITLSLIFHAIAYPLAYPLYTVGLPAGRHLLGWFGLLFVGPALFGLLLGLNVRKRWTTSILDKLGLHVVHPLDTAWDRHFSDCRPCWVMAVLKDGTQWAGYLGPHSFASSDPAERDIYIQNVYEVGRDGEPWVPRASSVWIAHGEIQTLEFWPLVEDVNDDAGDADLPAHAS
jgi:hypothetical protein